MQNDLLLLHVHRVSAHREPVLGAAQLVGEGELFVRLRGLGYSAEPAVLYRPQGRLAPFPSGSVSRLERGSAISSFRASARIEAAYSAFEGIGGGTGLAALAAERAKSR